MPATSRHPLRQQPHAVLQHLPRPSPHLITPVLANIKQQQPAPTRCVRRRIRATTSARAPLQPWPLRNTSVRSNSITEPKMCSYWISAAERRR